MKAVKDEKIPQLTPDQQKLRDELIEAINKIEAIFKEYGMTGTAHLMKGLNDQFLSLHNMWLEHPMSRLIRTPNGYAPYWYERNGESPASWQESMGFTESMMKSLKDYTGSINRVIFPALKDMDAMSSTKEHGLLLPLGMDQKGNKIIH